MVKKNYWQKVLFAALMLCMCKGIQAQGTLLCNEQFKKTLSQGWSVYPAYTALSPTWRTESGICVSSSYAAHGYVPYGTGDTAELVTPFFDCSQFGYVMLKFNHICKILPGDICAVQYQEQGVGAHYRWTDLPKDSYLGNSSTFKSTQLFDHSSYPEWKANDTFAIPTNGWWKEESFDVSNYVSYSNVRFRFIIRKGSYLGSFIAAGWYIDDVQVLVGQHMLKPPVVTFTSTIGDTVYTNGPFTVSAKVVSRTFAPIIRPYLHVVTTYNNKSTHDSIRMWTTAGDSLWECSIPKHYYTSSVQYYIIGRDSFGNSARANSGYYIQYPKDYDSNSVALTSFDAPTNISLENPQPVRVTIQNKGIKNLTSAVVYWSLNGVVQGSKNYKGNLMCDYTDTLTVGKYVHRIGGYDHIVAWIKMPNGFNDKKTNDDTIQTVALGCVSAAKGTYVIGPNGDYKTYDDALKGIQTCSVGGDITLAFAAGTHALGNGSIVLNTDFMNGYKLTITSVDKDRERAIITTNNTTGTVNLDKAENVTFSYITLQNLNTMARSINLNGKIENVLFYHCNILSPNTAGNGIGSCISKNDEETVTETVRNFRFIGNNISGGCRSTMIGDGFKRMSRIRIDSNVISDSYDGILKITNADSVSFCFNTCRPRNNADQNCYGIKLENVTVDSVFGNTIDMNGIDHRAPSGVALSLSNIKSISGKQTLVANNVIIGSTSSGWPVGIGLGQMVGLTNSNVNFCYNSIYNNRKSAYPNSAYTAGVHCLAINGSSSDCRIYGNLISTFDPVNQYALMVDASLLGHIDIDYNNYWNPNGTLAMFGNIPANELADIQNYSQGDQHSLSINPNFTDITKGLQLKDYNLFVMPNIGVSIDHEGESRGKVTAMGAYTSKLQKLDAALTDFGKTTLASGKNCSVEVTLINLGEDALRSATIEWIADGVKQNPVSWSGTLNSGSSATVTLGKIMVKSHSESLISAWVTKPNQSTDMNPNNDTIRLQQYICNGRMNGIYTVGGKSPDFADFETALYEMNQCGISGPVVLQFRAGTYKSLTINGTINGQSNTNLILIMAETNAIVNFDGGNNTPGILLRNASNWVFQHVNFGNLTNGVNGVLLEGSNENILFHDCGIFASTTATTSNKTCSGICFNSSSGSKNYPKNVRFIHNDIKGGNYNVYMNYMAGSAANMTSASLYLDSNNMSEAYSGGLSSNNYSHYPSISYNTITNRAKSGQFIGLHLNDYANTDIIQGNRIIVKDAQMTYGIYMSKYQNTNANGGNPGFIINNEILIKATNAAYGIYLGNLGQTWNLLHNSIYVESGSYSFGIYPTSFSNAYPISIRNNLIAAKGIQNYPLYIPNKNYALAAYSDLDYNNYYSPTHVGYIGGAITSLLDWQKLTLQDAHSVNVAPLFANLYNDLSLNDYAPFICAFMKEVPSDINNKNRALVTTMGCYGSNDFSKLNLKAMAFQSPVPLSALECAKDYEDIMIKVLNTSRVSADFSQSPMNIHLEVSGAANIRNTTLINKGRLAASDSATYLVYRLPITAGGTYSIRVILSDTADKNADDDTLSTNFKVSRIDLPYDVDFSAMPDEITNVTLCGNAAWKLAKGDGVNPAATPVYGNGRMEFNGLGNAGSEAEAILSGVMLSQKVNPVLSFWYAHAAEKSKGDSLIVKATTDGGITYTVLGRIATADTGNSWKRYEYNLSGFANARCLSIVFHAVSGGLNQHIDRIRICESRDFALALLTPDVRELSACHLQNVELKAVVTNTQGGQLTLNDTLRVEISGAASTNFILPYKKQLNAYAQDTLLLSKNLNLSANGMYAIKAYLDSEDDEATNDTARTSVCISQDISMVSVSGINVQTEYQAGDGLQLGAKVFVKGNVPVDQILLQVYCNGDNVFTDTVNRRLYTNDTLEYSLSRPFTVPNASKNQPTFTFELKALLPCDADNTDNEVRIIGNVNIPDTVDVQVTDISSTSPSLGKTELNPDIRILNAGNISVSNVILHLEVRDSALQILKNLKDTIARLDAYESRDIHFHTPYATPNYDGQYYLKAYIETVDRDNDPSNDTLTKAFACTLNDVGIRSVGGQSWTLEQNMPNPTDNLTRISYSVPQAGKVLFCVMSINGQMLYRKTIEVEAGLHYIEFNTDELAAGIYYYSMEYQGQRITRKMNVAK